MLYCKIGNQLLYEIIFEYSSNKCCGTQWNNFFHDDYFGLHLWILVITTML